MAGKRERLKLYEALELRSELDARIQTVKDCLPETRQNRKGFFTLRENGDRRPSSDFDVAAAREGVKRLELRRRKLNAAIQQANLQHRLEHDGESMTLNEALEVRKGLNEAIGELHSQLVDSAWQRVIYKEDRDIVEESDLSYTECSERLERARLAFRSLNRRLRAAAFEVSVEFADE
jgi:hypothetical protein